MNSQQCVQRFVMRNMYYPSSALKHIHFLRGALCGKQDVIAASLASRGYCIVRDTQLEHELFTSSHAAISTATLQSCIFGADSEAPAMDYGLGTDQRPKYNHALLGVNDQVSSRNAIDFHNELVYTNEFPRRLGFVCVVPAAVGGYTPLSDVRAVFAQLPGDMRDKFLRYGIRYVRNIRDKRAEQRVARNPIDVGGQKCFQDLFQTEEAAEAQHIAENVYKYRAEWLRCRTNDTPILRVQYDLPAVMSIGGTTAFANSMLGMHGSFFDDYDDYYHTLPLIERPLHSLWGNGDEFSADEIASVRQLYRRNAIRFAWAAGDVIIVDNLWWAHGRYPYHGDRKILALMGVPWARQQGSFAVAAVTAHA